MGIKGFENQEERAELFAIRKEMRRIQKKLAIISTYRSAWNLLSKGSTEHELYYIAITGLYDSVIMDFARIFDSRGSSGHEHCTLRRLRSTCAKSVYFPDGENNVYLKKLEGIGRKYSDMISEIQLQRNTKLAHTELNQALNFLRYPDIGKIILFLGEIK